MTRTTANAPRATASATTRIRPHCSGNTAGRRGASDLRRTRFHIRQTLSVQEAFGIVLFGVVAVAAIVAFVPVGMRARAYEQIGRGGLSLREDEPPKAPTGAVAARERDAEIRQMLAARNARRTARGEAPLDVESERARLTQPVFDPALEAEVRSLVIARNERRARKGQEPLDVEAEVARQMKELS